MHCDDHQNCLFQSFLIIQVDFCRRHDEKRIIKKRTIQVQNKIQSRARNSANDRAKNKTILSRYFNNRSKSMSWWFEDCRRESINFYDQNRTRKSWEMKNLRKHALHHVNHENHTFLRRRRSKKVENVSRNQRSSETELRVINCRRFNCSCWSRSKIKCIERFARWQILHE